MPREPVRLGNLIRGLPGHPIHPPLTDATIGIYTGATIFGLLNVLGIGEKNPAYFWWLALVLGLIVSAPTALTGFVDWLSIQRGTPLWRTATSHMIAMLTATLFFLLAALFGKDDYDVGDVSGSSFVLTLVGFGLLTLGGWFGGAVVFVHGMRVLNLVEEPAGRAASPTPDRETKTSERT